MTEQMRAFLTDLAEVLERHKGGLCYTTDDDGVHAELENDKGQFVIEGVCIGFPRGGDVREIRELLK